MYKNILIIDTSTEYCFITLKNKNIIYNEIKFCPFSHIKYILHLIHHILKKNNLFLTDLDLLGCNLGPGNFTSLRIGIAIIDSISYALNIPKIGLSHLMIIAEKSWKLTGITNIITVIKYNKNYMYFALYKKNLKGLWIGKNSECLLHYDDFIKKILILKGIWVLISNIDKNIKINIKKILNKNLKIYFIKNLFTSSEVMIDIVNNILLNKKKIKKYYKINYIKNIF
ncbi:tRNA (adenosine(37)-N6)-threonylcarbamoyltransferase complex dimerization subunit type 1 TsaB [Enterobacteriaceae endosymbiont of Donacia versicolorea]|uniref:tRNA (adenosine(37)-N6)-threonylcarbamoyltransferase complex dimerization subunit type 1 TsaB n=1 Tax=Enterobacteriaceae endosymbiont of Donacia versicolorea TaxID=2675788 RepID=UPI001449AA32|nr:tRNA (adenosine(37)-N6)-threonylcarbamoyltransferase complex dimerization subunit type 1 TsaB [Enterobacteriaceae endosymbiont of Donacia versicolorea]QJC31988.1 tRNA (adenosine(37)-N6)-threonylcarbamoyltransferase complex dimerization subunit type 1 TsaB [Enterobacteriaceae endosymbiont of Donacia versicolorea]